LVELGMVDEDRLGTMGWSQGSILSNALIAYDQRFKVASCGAGGAEWVSYWGQSYVGYSLCEYYLGASPIEDPNLYKDPELAPFYDAEKVETPVIMFTGSGDQNVPPCQVWITYRGIQRYGSAPVELYVFPCEPHVLQQLSHQKRKMVEEQKWFDEHFFDT
jgi:dipeptidyl aminopeptidase/acylaminoacyl peptidase